MTVLTYFIDETFTRVIVQRFYFQNSDASWPALPRRPSQHQNKIKIVNIEITLMMDVDAIKSAPMCEETILWFEFLLKPELLEGYLKKEKSPRAIEIM